jgi:hypothetical protein
MPQRRTTQYQICDLILESNIPLTELQQAPGPQPHCSFHLLSARERQPLVTNWFHHWTLSDGGDAWLSFGRWDRDYLLRFPDLADFLLSADGNSIRCFPGPGIPLGTIRHLLLDQVIPLLLSQQGKIVLHAGAVGLTGGAVAFLGKTGLGKSTLTASFCDRGFRLLTDDCLALKNDGEQLIAIPSYRGVRLWPEIISAIFQKEPAHTPVAHYTRKRRVIPNSHFEFCLDPIPLKRIYALTPPDELSDTREIRIRSLTKREALMELVKQTYRLDITDRTRIGEEFHWLARAAAMPLFYSLAFPRDIALLPAVLDAIIADIRELI